MIEKVCFAGIYFMIVSNYSDFVGKINFRLILGKKSGAAKLRRVLIKYSDKINQKYSLK